MSNVTQNPRALKRTLATTIAVAAALILTTRPAVADDDTKDVEVEIEAPLDAKSCDTAPATITVLGLTIDISDARVEATAVSTPVASATPASRVDDGGRRRKGSGGTAAGNCYYNVCTSPPAAATPTGCAALTVGQPVEVKVASDPSRLVATAVQQDADAHNVKLQGPLQAFDSRERTISVLGLTIDVSGAGLQGADDDSSDGHSQPIDLSHLMVGQSVEVVLAAGTAPLIATEVEVKNFSNQLHIEVRDPDGNSIGDVDDRGNPVDDVQVDVVQTIPVLSSTPGTSGASERKVLTFHKDGSGSFTLSGLATARARLFVTRVHDGETSVSHHVVRVRTNATRSVHVRLRPGS